MSIHSDLGIGRSEECDCTLQDQAASSWHAIVKDVEGHLALIDLGSTNHTRVRGGPLLRRGDYVFLEENQELLIGRTVLRVEAVEQAENHTLRIEGGGNEEEAWTGSREAAAPEEPVAADPSPVHEDPLAGAPPAEDSSVADDESSRRPWSWRFSPQRPGSRWPRGDRIPADGEAAQRPPESGDSRHG